MNKETIREGTQKISSLDLESSNSIVMGRYTLTIKEGSKGSRKISFTSIEEMKEMGTTIISLAENLRSDES